MISDWDPAPPDRPAIPQDGLRRALSEGLVFLATAGHRMTEVTAPHYPNDESPAAFNLLEEESWAVPTVNEMPIREASQTIYLTMTSGHDHMQTLGLALAMRRDLGTSLMTVIRGALEAYARCYFLMGDLSTRGILVRYLASRRSVLDYGARELRVDGIRRATEFSDASREMLEKVEQLATAWSISTEEINPTRPGAGVQQLLVFYNESSGYNVPTDLYSLLSETAHAETIGFRFFMTGTGVFANDGQEAMQFGLDYDYLILFLQVLVGVHEHVMTRYLDYCGATAEQRADWTQAILNAKGNIPYLVDETPDWSTESEVSATEGPDVGDA